LILAPGKPRNKEEYGTKEGELRRLELSWSRKERKRGS